MNKIRQYDNQDSMFDKRCRNYIAAAVSDGAGSCKHSAIASNVACNAAVNYWINNISFIKKAACELIAENTMTVVQYSLMKAAKTNKHDYKDYCCTLVMCLINKKSGELITLHVGDGSIYELEADGMNRISDPQNGLFRYQTFFVNQDNSIEHCRVQKRRSKNGIMLCSDGLDSLFPVRARGQGKRPCRERNRSCGC